ncbi:MAG: mechanosensitive ion channel family protein [Cyanobium sp.]
MAANPSTVLAPDNVRHIVPNGKFFADTIGNYSSHPYRRVELEAQLDSSADVNRAIALLTEALKAVPNQAVRPYTHNDHYRQVVFDTNRVIADTLSRNGFPVPRIPVQLAQTPN